MRGMEGDSGRKEKEQSCSLGQIFCCFIRFSVNRLVFARTGTQGSVEESAREERSREWALPAARAFTLRSSSVQTLQGKRERGQQGWGQAQCPP